MLLGSEVTCNLHRPCDRSRVQSAGEPPVDNSLQGRVALDVEAALYDHLPRAPLDGAARQIRILVGGDYGFAATPQWTNADDLAHVCARTSVSAPARRCRPQPVPRRDHERSPDFGHQAGFPLAASCCYNKVRGVRTH